MTLLACSSFIVLLVGADVPAATIHAIGARYQGNVEQAFEAHCADCHGRMPANLPDKARKTAQGKARKAHKRLNMDDGFPFTSKWQMEKLIGKIGKAVRKNDMPPKKYLKQKGSTLSDAERDAIIEWARDAQAMLKGD